MPGALFNRAIQGAYPPGSTFKPFIGAAALKQRFISEHTALNCPGEYEVPATPRTRSLPQLDPGRTPAT